MDIFKIPACWPSTFVFGISVTEMLQKENQIEGKYKQLNCYNGIKVANLSRETSQASIFVFEYFINNAYDLSKYDIQLISMACILLCSKMHDVKPLSMSTLHRISAYVYNNQMVLNAENQVLRMLNYDLFVRDRLIIDRVGLYLEALRFLIYENDFDKFKELCFKVTDLIFEDISLIKENEFNLLCAGIIQASMVISIRRDGKLPITIRLSILSNHKEEEIMKFSKKIIKHCLGKNVYKKFNF